MAHYSFYARKKVSSPGIWINQFVAKKLSAMLLHVLPAAEGQVPTVIEIGPGKGMFATYLKNQRKIDYTAYEPEPQMFEHLQSLGINVINKTVPPLLEGSESINAVAMLNILEHISDIRAVEQIIQECFRVLIPGGIIFIVVPSFLDWKAQFYNLDYTHQIPFTESRLRNLIADYGGRIDRIAYHYGCFFSDIGRCFNTTLRGVLAGFSWLLPRSISRSDAYQKAGILFAENIICIARKTT